ncbi:hypothetical protein F5050DRAFT_433916 [Lentinula boryana]|uniref:Zn(2)-C6 fungal-type domain-containing protein n=1 Tax=Lentinula boryana TaxID=40481 RepID=A0ABQ8Q835_9AGAR|nr:hypothetical protein F5050DRAFT_433916 [Lentinula boryana]
MEHPYLREASTERRKGRPPKSRPGQNAKMSLWDHTSYLSDTEKCVDDREHEQAFDNDDNLEGVTDDLRRTFRVVYKKHGSLKERRDLNIKYRHVGCEQCISRNKPCEIRATALQCGNCPPYVKCTRVPILKRLRVLDIMDITEQQYDCLLAWYKKTAEEELLGPLRESFKIPSASEESSSSSGQEPVVPENISPHSFLVPLNAASQDHNEYSVPCKPTTNSLATQHFPFPASHTQEEQWPREEIVSPMTPYYTLPSPYQSPSPRLLAPTASYRIPDSFVREYDEDSPSACVVPNAQPYGTPGQYSAVTWNRCNEICSHSEASGQQSIAYSGGVPTCYATHDQSRNEYRYDRQPENATKSSRFPSYSGYDRTGYKFSFDYDASCHRGLPEDTKSSSKLHSWNGNTPSKPIDYHGHQVQGVEECA